MQIKQWKDKPLAHFSYAVLSDEEHKIVVIDPARDPQPYLDYAREQGATIIGIIETHPHADFISGHLELSQLTGAAIYTSSLAGATYPHAGFEEGQQINLGEITLTALNTPGHSPDSISIVLETGGKHHALFSGDTLFVGDCGRPDLREEETDSSRIHLATAMYQSLRNKLLPLADEVLVYPAHGAGSLCGKALGDAPSSTMGAEKKANWSLQPMSEEEFVDSLLKDQPFVPAYFPFAVKLNQQGAPPFEKAIRAVKILPGINKQTDTSFLKQELMIIDARNEKIYKQGHLENSVNIMEGLKFDTWLGSIIQPGEAFHLAGESTEQIKELVKRAAAIGYEEQINAAFTVAFGEYTEPLLDLESFKKNQADFTIVDVRNEPEVTEKKIFATSISIPLHELRWRVHELPTDKPMVVHCAGGYRSAIGSSLINSILKYQVRVYDLGDSVKDFQ